MKKENFGKIIKIDSEKGYGFVRSDADNKDYYFKTYALGEGLVLFDNVVFLINNNGDNAQATAIRKYFINKHGIKFFPRVDNSHIHIKLNNYFPLIVNHIDSIEVDFRTEVYQFEKVIGKTDCVKTNNSDDIVYAIRKGRHGYSRFVHNRLPEETNSIKTVLKKSENGYLIITLFYGGDAGPEPYDERANEKDIQFWHGHALLYKKDDIIESTETTDCPWVLN